MSPLLTVMADDLVEPVAPGWQLITATLVGIALLVLLITVVKLNPFLALILGGLTVGAIAGENLSDVITSFTTGFGTTVASVGVLIALGAIFAKLLAESGGADQVVDTIVGHASGRALPWAMAAVGAIIGLPMFFEIGLVLLMPVIYLVARRAQVSLITVGIPALAGLSAMHGFVPPHPGPVVAIGLLHANLGVTLGLGILVAIPTIIVAGPLYGTIAGRWVVVEAPTTFDPGADERVAEERRPSFAVTIATILLPVVLMLAKALADIVIDDPEDGVQKALDVIGNPFIALLIGVLVAMVTFGVRVGMDRNELSETVAASLPPIAGHPADRRGRWRVQAGAGRQRRRHAARQLGAGRERVRAAALVGARRADPAGHRLGDHRDHHRVVAGRRPRRRDADRARCRWSCSRSAPARCSSRT